MWMSQFDPNCSPHQIPSYDGKCLFMTNPRIGDHRRSAL